VMESAVATKAASTPNRARLNPRANTANIKISTEPEPDGDSHFESRMIKPAGQPFASIAYCKTLLIS
jgi:hypothetical protein